MRSKPHTIVSLIVAALVAPAAPGQAAAQVSRLHAGRPVAAAVDRAVTRPHADTHAYTLVDEARGAVIRSAPAGRIIGSLSGRTPLGTTTWLWAVAESRDHRWARVVLPWTPNGRTGWVWLRGRRVVRTHTWVQADLSRRRVMLMRSGEVRRSFVAAVGAPGSPTPIGRFSVTDPIATGDPSGPFGWYAFGLSGHQPNLPAGWSGGDQLAIHGTNDQASLGRAASAGCLRVSAGALAVLKRALQPGTPVVIHP
jgi:L,D-transpeptidase catalytic domain